MGVAGEAIEHPSDLTKVPGRIIERRMVRAFSFVNVLFPAHDHHIDCKTADYKVFNT